MSKRELVEKIVHYYRYYSRETPKIISISVTITNRPTLKFCDEAIERIQILVDKQLNEIKGENVLSL